jgi:hypothetical protein
MSDIWRDDDIGLASRETFDMTGGGEMYVNPNFKTKKAFKEAVANGDVVTVFSPGLFPAPKDGTAYIEGPHYPEPHRWYAKVTVSDGKVVKVVS